MDTNLRNTQVDLLISKPQNLRQRRMTNLPSAVNSSDAATLGDVKKAIAAAQSSSTTPIYSGPSVTSTSVVKSLGTVYRNISGKALYVCVTIVYSPASGATHSVNALVDTASAPVAIAATTSISFTIAGITDTLFLPMFVVVPPNYYYKYVITAGAPTLSTWTEWS